MIYMDYCKVLPSDTKIYYANDPDNIIHLTKESTFTKKTIYGVDKNVNTDIFNFDAIKHNIVKSMMNFRAEKKIFSNTINIYRNRKLISQVKKEKGVWNVYYLNENTMKISCKIYSGKPTDWLVMYKYRDAFISLINSEYITSGDINENIAFYKIIPDMFGISSKRNTIITNNNTNVLEFLKFNENIYKIGYSNLFNDFEAFIFGALVLLLN